ncbi:MAG: hypothetical protein RMI34_10505 [Chloroherpetonaceae bacterium]|nr:hypothetical protein [Chloroherpetonaceae bacterium]MCS7210825.1 hypothetical protein [Chloroherpetonaceae bacterium]MDW8020492.1 hypothetical protein [Chloroherpetonaceae bacterium]MDW8465364.1 hypothetical protein [Chloroherpetonaceae bacterium]
MKRYIYRRTAEAKSTLDSLVRAFKKQQLAHLDSLLHTLSMLPPPIQEKQLIIQKAAEFERLEQFRAQLDAELDTLTRTLASHLENLMAVELALQSAAFGATPKSSAALRTSATAASAEDSLLSSAPLSPPTTPLGFNFNVSFSSQSVWYGIQQNVIAQGEADAISGSIASISGTYTHPTGLWGSIEVTGLFGQSPFVDQLTLSVGAERTFFEFLTVGVLYSRYFYSANSVQFSAAISDNLGLYLTLTNPIVTPSVNFNYGFAQGPDMTFLTLSGSHTFVLEQFFGGLLFISPSAYVDFGSLAQYTIQLERQNRPLPRSTLRNQRLPELTARHSVSYAFMPLSATLSLSLSYALGSFSFTPAISYTLPLNTPTYTLEFVFPAPSFPIRPPAIDFLSEPRTPLFYFSLAASVTL